MKVIDFLDHTVCSDVIITQDNNLLFDGKVENTPYKYVHREVLEFGFKYEIPVSKLALYIKEYKHD